MRVRRDSQIQSLKQADLLASRRRLCLTTRDLTILLNLERAPGSHIEALARMMPQRPEDKVPASWQDMVWRAVRRLESGGLVREGRPVMGVQLPGMKNRETYPFFLTRTGKLIVKEHLQDMGLAVRTNNETKD